MFELGLKLSCRNPLIGEGQASSGWKGGPGQGRLWMAAAAVFPSGFQALQEVAEHVNGGSAFTSAFIFPISAGQTEKLINCMKPK